MFVLLNTDFVSTTVWSPYYSFQHVFSNRYCHLKTLCTAHCFPSCVVVKLTVVTVLGCFFIDKSTKATRMYNTITALDGLWFEVCILKCSVSCFEHLAFQNVHQSIASRHAKFWHKAKRAGPLFTKRCDVLEPNIVRSRSYEIA